MKVQRKPTTAGGTLEFEFDVKGQEFTVKNFSNGRIYVSDKTPVVEDESILIPALSGQDITTGNRNAFGLTAVSTLYIKAEAENSFGVEVQVLSW